MATIRHNAQHGIFIAESTFDEISLFSAKRGGLGWRFCGGGCAARWRCKACAAGAPAKTWWTDDAMKVRPLLDHCDESARAALGEVEKVIELSGAADADGDFPCPAGLAYLPYQRAGIAYGLKRESVLIADEMGLGKTIQALGIANADPSVDSILILCPASLRINWAREASKWLVRDFGAPFIVTSGKDEIPAGARLVICNYDLVWRKGILPQLMGRDFSMLVADEVHLCKNARGAKRAKALLGEYDKKARAFIPGLVSKARRKVFLTGTPLPNGKADEAWPLLKSLAPATFRNWQKFVVRYAAATRESVRVRGGWRQIWTMNHDAARPYLGELQDTMRASCMVRRVKSEVLAELPAKRHQMITLPADDAALRATLKAEAKKLAGSKAALAALLDAGQYDEAAAALGSMEVSFEEISKMRAEAAAAKIPAAVEHCTAVLDQTAFDGTPSVPKLIVFAHHHAMIDALAAQLAPYGVVKVDGRDDMAARQNAVDSFQGDESVRVFIGQIQAAGVGLTLTAASHVVFAELSWVPGDNAQAEDRAHRIGQTESVLVQHLVLEGSLDELVARLLQAKAARSDAALDASTKAANAGQREAANAVVAEAAAKTERREAQQNAREAARAADAAKVQAMIESDVCPF
jgi:SWI/SNF-related matrix-associated actin-dependent regulator 1 of chromatin subfamily A